MATPPSISGLRPPGAAAAEALAKAGLLPAEHREKAAAILAKHQAPAAFPFEADVVYLTHCMSHHIGAHFRQVMEPAARSHRASAKVIGKLISDEEIEKGTQAIVELVAGELSDAYMEHMYKYFGDLEGLAGYLYSRVRSILLEEALRYNNEFLARINQGKGASAIVDANRAPAGAQA